jgi:hypothetical protein
MVRICHVGAGGLFKRYFVRVPGKIGRWLFVATNRRERRLSGGEEPRTRLGREISLLFSSCMTRNACRLGLLCVVGGVAAGGGLERLCLIGR